MFLSNLFERKQAATVPSMDGALRPNDALDKAQLQHGVDAPDNLVATPSGILFSSGNGIFPLIGPDTPGAAALHQFEVPVTALAASAQGALAVGLDRTGIRIVGGSHDGAFLDRLSAQPAHCVTALEFQGEDTLLVCLGSARNSALDWQRDLLESRASGSLWRVDLTSGRADKIAGKLAFPNGLICRNGEIIVSESWRHRLLRFTTTGADKYQQSEQLTDLPGYPGRMAPTASGGTWLTVFAPRSQLIEFVLREHGYRKKMLSELAPEYWIAPSLRSGLSFSEPMQGGAVKVHGIYKPWAPSRSYGLLIELDANWSPIRSHHSRADGHRHGIVSVVQQDGHTIFASRGDNAICSLGGDEPGKEGT